MGSEMCIRDRYKITPVVVDPAADAKEAKQLYGISFASMDAVKDMDAVIVAVAHKEFTSLKEEDFAGFFRPEQKKVLLDIKGLCDRGEMEEAGYLYWRL